MESEFVEFRSETRRNLSEIQIDENSSFIEFTTYLELILYGPFSVWEEEGELILYEVKVRVDKYRGLEFRINPNEHPPPHFHVYSGNSNASFTIDDCSLITGDKLSGDLRKIQYWHSFSKHKLIETWNATRPSKCVVGKLKESSEKTLNQ